MQPENMSGGKGAHTIILQAQDRVAGFAFDTPRVAINVG